MKLYLYSNFEAISLTLKNTNIDIQKEITFYGYLFIKSCNTLSFIFSR